MLWLKLNIYSLLLSGIGTVMTAVMFCFWDESPWWMILIVFAGVYFIFLKAVDIFRRYEHKADTFHKLIKKLRKKYDLRYCYPYMDTACMRCVVYFALCEIGKRKDYKVLKCGTWRESYTPHHKIVSVTSVNGKLQFTSRDSITGEYEEI